MTLSPLNHCGHLEWAVAGRPAPGEPASGDAAVVRAGENRCMLAVVDGLGHGPEAATSAAVAVEIFERNYRLGVTELLALAHQGLADGRGAAATVAVVDGPSGTLSWLGVGNVDGVVLHQSASGRARTNGVLLRGGVLGRELPWLQEPTIVQLADRDCIALATDGVRGDLISWLRTGLRANVLAQRLLDDHASEVDDALVLVARYRAEPIEPEEASAASPGAEVSEP